MCYCNKEDKKRISLLRKEPPTSHIAIEAGLRWSEGLESIFKRDKFESLVIPDNDTGLLPFMIAATENNSDLSTLYRMIVQYPEVLFDSNTDR